MSKRKYLKAYRNKKIRELEDTVCSLKSELKTKTEVLKLLMDTRLEFLTLRDSVKQVCASTDEVSI